MRREKPSTKVSIIGVGMVGSSTAFAIMMKGLATEITLIDANPKRAEGEAMDLNHGLPFSPTVSISSGTMEDLRDSDVVIVTAGAPRKPGMTRLDLASVNLEVIRSIIPQVARHAPDSVILVVSNPVDIMTYAAIRLSGFPPSRVLGTGTMLDSARFRYLIGSHCGIDTKNVHAYILGEHGDSGIPAWSLANLGGSRLLDEICPVCDRQCKGLIREEIDRQVKEAAPLVIEYKGATYYAIALAITDVVEAILRDEHSIKPVSVYMDGENGIDGVCLSVPAILCREGVAKHLEISLTPQEQQGLERSSAVLKETIGSLGIG